MPSSSDSGLLNPFTTVKKISEPDNRPLTSHQGGRMRQQLAKVIRNVVLVSIEGRNQRERLKEICTAADHGERGPSV